MAEEVGEHESGNQPLTHIKGLWRRWGGPSELSGLGLVVKRVSLAGNEEGPQKCQTHGGN